MKKNDAPLKHVIKKILTKLEIKEKNADGRLISAWNGTVGRSKAKHTKLVSFRGGRLVVNVSDSSRLYELTLNRKDIISKINKKLESKKLKEIRFKIGEI